MRSTRLKSLLLALAVCAAILAADIWTPLRRSITDIDRVARVAMFGIRGPRRPGPDLRVVGITQNTISAFAEHGIMYPPLPRDIHAVALRRLADAGARTLVVDILFSEEGSWSEAEDKALADALRYCRQQGCAVVLAAAIDQSLGGAARSLVLPAPLILEAGPRLGASNAAAKLSYKLDERILESIELDEGGELYGQAVEALRIDCERAERDAQTVLHRFAPPGASSFRINYCGQLDDFSGVAYEYSLLFPELLDAGRMARINALRDAREAGTLGPAGEAELHRLWAVSAEDGSMLRKLFAGTVVFLGSRNELDNDYFDTPFGRMFGVDTNAQAYDTLARGRPIRVAPGALVFAWCFALTLAGWALSLTRPILRSALLGLLAFLATGALSLLLFRLASVELAPTLPLACFILPFAASLGFSGSMEEQAKRTVRESFSRYVSPELVAQVLADPSLARAGAGVEREAAVLFNDIRNYSTISERMDPEQVIRMLNIYFAEAAEAVRRHGGSVDKYLGDGLMASFGSLVPRPAVERDAAQAAVDIITGLYEHVHPRLEAEGFPRFKVGIGLHSGRGVSGNIGSASRFDPTFIGDTTNVASRVETATKEYGWAVLCTREFAEKAQAQGSGLHFAPVGETLVKGRSQPVELFCISPVEKDERFRL